MKKFVWIAAFVVAVAFSGTAFADGGATFGSKCAACHGAAGAGGPMAPALAGSDFIKGDAAAVAATIKNGREGGDKKYANFPLSMPKFDGQISDGDIDAIVTYLKGL